MQIMPKKSYKYLEIRNLISSFQFHLILFLAFGLLDLIINIKTDEIFSLDISFLRGLLITYLIYIGIAFLSFICLTFLLRIICWIKKVEISAKMHYKAYLSFPLFFLVFIEALYINSDFYANLSITHSKRIYGALICLVIAIVISLAAYYIALWLSQRAMNKKKAAAQFSLSKFIPLLTFLIIAVSSIIFLLLSGSEESKIIKSSKTSANRYSPSLEIETENLHPNIVFISIDTLRADRLGCYGYKKVATPNIDSLAQRGVRFSKAFAPVPITLPSHASMMTGLHPLNLGCISNRWIISEEVLTLPEILKQHGYYTASFISGYPLFSSFGFGQGFLYYDEQLRDYSYPFKKLKHCFIVRIIEGMRLIADLSGTRQAEETTDSAISWLRKNERRSFFLFIHYWDPHKPLFTPARYHQKDFHPNTSWLQRLSRFIPIFRNYAYDSEIAYVDYQISRILSTIDGLNLSGKTIIIFTADHGEGLGDHNYNDHVARLYQEQIHIPLIMIYPEHLPAGKTVSSLVRLQDIMPTLLELLNLPVPKSIDGVSLISRIYGKEKEEDLILQASAQSQNEAPHYNLWAVMHKEWKLIYQLDKKENIELYNLNDDPHELVNLERKIPLQESQLKNLLIPWQQIWENKHIKKEIIEYKEAIERLKTLGYIQ